MSYYKYKVYELISVNIGTILLDLTQVRPLYTLSRRGSDNSALLIVFSANYIDQSIFYVTESRLNRFVIFKTTAMRSKYAA